MNEENGAILHEIRIQVRIDENGMEWTDYATDGTLPLFTAIGMIETAKYLMLTEGEENDDD